MFPFFRKCVETAVRETRIVTLLAARHGVPAGSYVFHEYYCDNLSCDCRRVIILVTRAEDEEMAHPLATISYGWESPSFYRKWSGEDDPDYVRQLASVTLDPIAPQSDRAAGLREVFEECLRDDPELKLRFRRHYLEFRRAVRGPVRGKTGGGRIKRR